MDPKRILQARGYWAPAGDADGGGGDVDRGDDFVPTGEDAIEIEAKTSAKEPVKAAAKEPVKAAAAAGDGDGDGDGDGEGEGEGEGTGEPTKGKKDARIPLKRHEAVLARERERREALEAQIAQFQGAKAVTETNAEITVRETKLVDLDKAYTKAMTDGETDKAASLMAEIRKLDREISTLESNSRIAAAEARAVEQTRYSIALERIEAQYPELDENSPDFDEDVFKEVLDLMKAYRASGRTPTDALQRAVKKELGARTAGEKAAVTVKPRVDKEDAQGSKAEDVRTERKKGAIDKALDAEAKSPKTAVAKTGVNNDADGAQLTAKDIIKMKHDKFVKLSEEDLARARGDVLDEA